MYVYTLYTQTGCCPFKQTNKDKGKPWTIWYSYGNIFQLFIEHAQKLFKVAKTVVKLQLIQAADGLTAHCFKMR